MRFSDILYSVVVLAVAVSIAGCGVPKDKYETLLSEKIALEEKVDVMSRARDALKFEYDKLLKEKMELSTKVEVVTNEKSALKSEYDKILDEKIAIRAVHDKLLAENKDLRDKLAVDKLATQ